MRVCVLGSGSSGNATFVEHAGTRLLIDAGLRAKEIVERLAAISVDPSSIHAVLVSHEHGDHIRGVGPLCRKFRIPLFISPRALGHAPFALQQLAHRPLAADTPLQLGQLVITPFSVPHDSIDPLAFSLRGGRSRVCVVTDIGILTEGVRRRLASADLLVVESNHDLEMLKNGPYPWPLKQRVMSNYGHLSNEALACFLGEHFAGSGRAVMLVHLSRQNNHPQIAFLSASRALQKKSRQTSLHVSLQDRISEIIEI
jgi:phosphoribosyl 1,2-cyclic phosphodiesterase